MSEPLSRDAVGAPAIDFDALTAEDLRAAGSMKWTLFPETIGAFVAEMDFGVAPPIVSAIDDALARGFTGYLPPAVASELAEVTARRYRDLYDWDVPVEHVHHVPDVIAALELAIEEFTPPGSAVIVPTPAYMPFLQVPVLHGREVIEVPSIEAGGRWTMDLAGIARAFDDGAGMLVLCNPHNPLGTVFTREELLAVADLVDGKKGRVFSDEIHAPLVYRPARHVPYSSVSETAASHTITAASASKAWNLAGLKCAQILFSNDADAARGEASRVGHGTSTLGVVANIAAYTEGGPWLEDVLDYLDGNRRRLVHLVTELLPDARVTLPEGTYIALIDFRAYGIEGDLGKWFRENAGVAMTDGVACGEAAIGCTRFVFAMPRPLLEQAIRRIAAALRAVR